MNLFMDRVVFTLILLLNVFWGGYMFYIGNLTLGFWNSAVAVIMLSVFIDKGFKNGK